MPHIHTEPHEHDHTVSAFIINTVDNTLLLHQHKVMKIWLQPGGHIELKENPWQAIQHELEEETGYTLDQLKVLQAYYPLPGLVETIHPVPLVYRTHPFPGIDHYHTDAAYAFTTEQLPSKSIGEDESDTLTWFTFKELKKLNPGVDIAADARTVGLHLLKKRTKLHEIEPTSFSL
jgi:8-oxo-dGTP diphosphatase